MINRQAIYKIIMSLLLASSLIVFGIVYSRALSGLQAGPTAVQIAGGWCTNCPAGGYDVIPPPVETPE